jgi:hypothetical protein
LAKAVVEPFALAATSRKYENNPVPIVTTENIGSKQPAEFGSACLDRSNAGCDPIALSVQGSSTHGSGLRLHSGVSVACTLAAPSAGIRCEALSQMSKWPAHEFHQNAVALTSLANNLLRYLPSDLFVGRFATVWPI